MDAAFLRPWHAKKPVVVLGERGEAELIGPDNVSEIAEFNFSGRHFRYRRPGANTPAAVLLQHLQNSSSRRAVSTFCYDYIRRQMDARNGAQLLADSVYPRALRMKNSFYQYAVWHLQLLAAGLKRKLRRNSVLPLQDTGEQRD